MRLHRASWAIPLLLLTTAIVSEDKPDGPTKFEAEIQKFEAADREQPPSPSGIMFYGSSSARLWNLSESFPNLPVVNRGFGGSKMSDAAHFYDRVVPAHQPRMIVLYEGDNDIASGRSACQVLADFETLLAKQQAALPECRLICLSIKYSPSRAKFRLEQEAANALLKARCARDPQLIYFDVARLLLNPDGQPDPKYFKDDMLHLNANGYQVWSTALSPLLAMPDSVKK